MSKNTLHFHKDSLHTVQLISKVTLFNTSELIQCTGSCKCLFTLHFHKDVLHTVQLFHKHVLHTVQLFHKDVLHTISLFHKNVLHTVQLISKVTLTLTLVSLYSVPAVVNAFLPCISIKMCLHTVQQISKASLFTTSQLIQCTSS